MERVEIRIIGKVGTGKQILGVMIEQLFVNNEFKAEFIFDDNEFI